MATTSETTSTTTATTATTAAKRAAPATPRARDASPPPGPSVLRRFLLAFAWSVFGLVFFYLVMVALSTISKGLTLERLARNGWPRAASRHTGAVTAPVFALFLMVSPASLWSLFLAVMFCCAHFAHFVILTSDLRVYADEEVVNKMFRLESTHPVWKLLPVYTPHVVGTIGFFAMLVVSSERCYGPALRKRQRKLPVISRMSCAWIWCVFVVWFVDRLVEAVVSEKEQEDILYPIPFLALLLLGALVAIRRDLSPDKKPVAEAKKTN